MRSVKKDSKNPPEKLEKCSERYMPQLLKEKEKHHFRNSCYNKTVRNELDALYHGKCAYCETEIDAGFFNRVDHYRPTSKYYWLAYEWSNLILVCEKCNTYKGNKFPIKNKKAAYSTKAFLADSPSLQNEKPFLLHPEIDEPAEYLEFNCDGEIYPKDENPRGTETINTCYLDRDELTIPRKKQVARIFEMLKRQALKILSKADCREGGVDIMDYVDKNSEMIDLAFSLVFEELIALQDAKISYAYTLLAKNMYEDFDGFFVHRLENNILKILIKNAFNNFKKASHMHRRVGYHER